MHNCSSRLDAVSAILLRLLHYRTTVSLHSAWRPRWPAYAYMENPGMHEVRLGHTNPDTAWYMQIDEGKFSNAAYTEENFVRGFRLTAAMSTVIRDDLVTMIHQTTGI